MKRLTAGAFGILLVGVIVFSAGAVPPLTATSLPGIEDQESNPEDFKIQVDVSLVMTDVTVIGKASSALDAEDFIVFEDGVAQPASFFSLDQIPLAVGLLIDASESIRPYLPVLQISGISALRRLKPEDQVVLYSFNLNPKRLSDLTEDRVQIAEEISKIEVAYGTNIYDSIVNAAEYLHKNAPNYRRAIILISDNYRVGGKHNANRALYELLETSTTLINIRTQSIAVFYDNEWAKSEQEVFKMVEETGGEVFRVNAPTSLQRALDQAVVNLRKQYTLGFNPSNPGKAGSFHKLTVKLASEENCPGCRIRSRSGYYSGVTAPAPPSRNARKPAVHSPEKTDQLLIQRSILAAGTVDVDLPDIPFQVWTTQQLGSDGQPELKIDLNIPFARVGSRIEESKHLCRLRVAVFYANDKGKILGSDWRTIEGRLSNESLVKAIQTGIPFSTSIPIKTEKQMVKVVVYDEETDRVGSKTIRLSPQ